MKTVYNTSQKKGAPEPLSCHWVDGPPRGVARNLRRSRNASRSRSTCTLRGYTGDAPQPREHSLGRVVRPCSSSLAVVPANYSDAHIGLSWLYPCFSVFTLVGRGWEGGGDDLGWLWRRYSRLSRPLWPPMSFRCSGGGLVRPLLWPLATSCIGKSSKSPWRWNLWLTWCIVYKGWLTRDEILRLVDFEKIIRDGNFFFKWG